ncbi:hypothetical protein A2V56_00740 [Candidatus Woesebacteria bacterium RBG_19FT_COMBO_42_9]|uniref:DUF218 domain-containing protein n=1 Tax=Candidatus Woesebacteria bacterium RBG_16_42_24 TaxID=1802485 RepID=A0A1F7XKD9_9BACT|nr:MAG: hypothetical protein A2V97_00600 [Candidatus Woesebacteria bacterium RBG_16_42_24]OGM16562.1 MAG: hypothetical protein A2V56_00740 [Candidatus Woesebacteria bacterium RBG_19FT_COMBO_42_9]OGM66184.1 MAG: hypothetical protein A2985_00715 [Candidatus Woesebacteria bacterium RIFCSPLOWO2_01_FULL_43_11]
MTKSHIDVLLVHCYWFDNTSANLLDAHGNLQLLAINCLLKDGIEQIVILGGKIDPQKESLGRVMYKELLKNVDAKLLNKVLVIPNSLTLRQEVKNFYKLAKKNNWQALAYLCLSAQLPRAKRTYRRIFAENFPIVTFLTTEEILDNCGYEKELKNYRESPVYKYSIIYELLVGIIDGIPIVGGYLIDKLSKIYPNKGVLLSKIFSFKSM